MLREAARQTLVCQDDGCWKWPKWGHEPGWDELSGSLGHHRVRPAGFRVATVSQGSVARVTVRVATWNVREGLPRKVHAFDPALVRAVDVANHLNEAGVDLVALQEVDLDVDGRSLVLDAIKAETQLRYVEVHPL